MSIHRRAIVVGVALAGAPQARAEGPCDLVVRGPTELNEAVAAAQDGATICLRPGRYELAGGLD